MTPRQPQSDTPRVSDKAIRECLESYPENDVRAEPYLDLRDARAALQASLQRVEELIDVLREVEQDLATIPVDATRTVQPTLALVRAYLREGVRST